MVRISLSSQGLVQAGLLHVQDLAPQRQDGLELPVPALLRGAAGGVALHQEELAQLRVPLLAVGQLARQPGAVEGALAAGEVPGLAGRLAPAGRVDDFLDDPLATLGRSSRNAPSFSLTRRLDDPLHLGVAELALGLPLELRVRDLDGDHGREALADVVALRSHLDVLLEVVGLGVVVDAPREGRPEARQVRAALDRC